MSKVRTIKQLRAIFYALRTRKGKLKVSSLNRSKKKIFNTDIAIMTKYKELHRSREILLKDIHTMIAVPKEQYMSLVPPVKDLMKRAGKAPFNKK